MFCYFREVGFATSYICENATNNTFLSKNCFQYFKIQFYLYILKVKNITLDSEDFDFINLAYFEIKESVLFANLPSSPPGTEASR